MAFRLLPPCSIGETELVVPRAASRPTWCAQDGSAAAISPRGSSPGEAAADSATARASAANPATSTSSARIVGSIPAAARSGGRSRPRSAAKAFSDWRSILRRWPNAAWVKAESVARSHGSGVGPRDQFDQARGHFRRRGEGGRRDVEQDPRLRPPSGQHREAAVIGALGRGRDDAAGDLALEHERQPVIERRPRLRLEPADERAEWRYYRADWPRSSGERRRPCR